MNSVHTAVLVMVGLGAVLLVAAAALTVARMARGPSSLDRVVAADVLVAITLPVMLVLSLLGFAGAVSIARFVAERDLAVRWRDSDRPDEGQQ